MLVSFVLNLCDSALLFGFGLPLAGLCARSEQPMPRQDQRLMRAVLALLTQYVVACCSGGKARSRREERRRGAANRRESSTPSPRNERFE